MASEKELMKQLTAPFPMKDIEWRAQRMINFSRGPEIVVVPYITARAVMNRLDDVFGIGGWKDEYDRWGEDGVKCRLNFKVGDEWLFREDGAEEPKMVPVKGGISDAFKRAAVKLGIGRYLYDINEVRVPLNDRQQYENDVYFRDPKTGKSGYWSIPDLPDWARIDEEKGKSNIARGELVARRGSSRTTQQAATPAQSKEEKITVRTLAALKKELDASFGEDGMARIVPFLKEQFNKESINDLTQTEGEALLQTLENARAKKKAAAAAREAS